MLIAIRFRHGHPSNGVVITPVIEKEQNIGRDHNTYGFSMWLAGGGVRGGCTHGAPDDFGHKAFKDIVTHHDYHATLAHLFGLEEKKVSVPRAAGIGAIARVSSCGRKMLHRAGGSTNRRHPIHRSRPLQ